MSDLYVKRQFCDEHGARDHWLDEDFHCHGASLADVERKGYSYAKHIGSGWFKLLEKYRPMAQSDLAWDMAADARQQGLDDKSWQTEPDF